MTRREDALMRLVLLTLALLLAAVTPARAYIEAPMTLADVINQSAIITILRVKSVDKSKNLIVYEKVEDIKGKYPTPLGRHVITGQLREGEIKTVIKWDEPGQRAILLHMKDACDTGI